MYLHGHIKALTLDRDESILVIVKILLVSSWTGQLIRMSGFLKDSIVCIAFWSNPICYVSPDSSCLV